MEAARLSSIKDIVEEYSEKYQLLHRGASTQKELDEFEEAYSTRFIPPNQFQFFIDLGKRRITSDNGFIQLVGDVRKDRLTLDYLDSKILIDHKEPFRAILETILYNGFPVSETELQNNAVQIYFKVLGREHETLWIQATFYALYSKEGIPLLIVVSGGKVEPNLFSRMLFYFTNDGVNRECVRNIVRSYHKKMQYPSSFTPKAMIGIKAYYNLKTNPSSRYYKTLTKNMIYQIALLEGVSKEKFDLLTGEEIKSREGKYNNYAKEILKCISHLPGEENTERKNVWEFAIAANYHLL